MSGNSSSPYNAPSRLSLATSDGRAVAGSGGPPHNPGMEARLTALEESFSRVDQSLARIEGGTLPSIKSDLSELKGKVSQLPTAMNILTYMGSLIALVMAVVGATIGLSRFLGH